MKKFKLLFCCLIIISCKTFGQQKGYVNPSAVYCERMGYKYEIRKDKNGNDVGVCILPNNTAVNAWDFYKGKVAQEYSYCAKMGYLTETERKDSAGIITECAVCVKELKNGKEERISMAELMKRDEGPLVNGCKKKDSNPIWEKAAYDKNFKYNKLLPNAFDWRNVNGHTYIGGIRDQGSCGSCYAFGANAAAEGTFNFVTGKFDADCIDLSESFIIWCLGSISPYSDHFSGCGGADYAYMELQALCDSGVCFESSFPYVQSNPGVCTHWNDPRVKMKEWYRVPCSDTTAIKTAIMTYGVVDAAVYVTTGFQNYSGGVYGDANTECTATPCYNTTTNHAISLVGWGRDPVQGLYWILRNSWGGSWGESGYMRLKWNSSRILCEVCYLVYYDKPTVTTLSASNIGNTYATINGKVNPNGKLTNYHFEYGTTTSYGNSTSLTPAGAGTSPINVSADIISLVTGTKYYFRIVASNADSISYGESMTFTPGMPGVSTTAASDITVNSCISGGNVISEGASPVTARGVCYSILPNPSITDSHTSDGSGVGSFISTINSLSSNTTYHIRAYATNSICTVYGNDLIFRTKCETLNLPYIEGFENGALPDCWTQEAGPPIWQFTNGNGSTNPASAHGGNFNALLKDKSSASNRNKLISPSLNLTGTSTPILKFWHTQELWDSDQDELRIYYRTSATGEWNLLATYINNISSWTQEIISLPNPGSDYYIAFEGDARWGYGVCIDDIEVFDLNCSTSYTQASNFGSADITMNSVNISWTRGNGDEVLVVANQGSPVNTEPVHGKIYDANSVFGSGEQIGTGNFVVYKGTGTQVSVSNLLSNATYYFSVYEYSTEGCYTIPALTGSATTIGCISYLLPFAEDFENGALPDCWTQETGPPTWQFISGNGGAHPASAHGGNFNALLKDASGASNRNKLISPSLNLTGTSTPILKFWHTQELWPPDQDELRIYYRTSATGEWNLIATYTNNIPSWTQEIISLPNPGSDYYIAFEGDAKYGYGVCIDDIEVLNFNCSASYTQASNFGSSDITTNSMNISWTRGNGDEVLVVAHQGGPVNADPANSKIYDANAVFGSGEQIGTGNFVVYKGTGTQVSVSNLLSNTIYYFSVYEYSSEGCYTIPALTGSATTSGCTSFLLPFTENFENSTFPPECWTSYRGENGLGTIYDWVRTMTGTYNSSAGAACVLYESVTGGFAEDWLVTPKISIPSGPTFSLYFYERQTFASDYGSQYYIKVSTTSQTDRATFVNISNYGETTFGTIYTQRSIDLSSYAGQDIYLAFVMVQNNGDDWYIDNININNTPPVTNVTWTGTTSTDWNTGSNWDDSNVPTIYKNVAIPAGCTNYPTVDETASCNNLTVQDGGDLIITNGADLNVKGNLAVGSGISGSFSINYGTCTVNGNLYSEVGCTVNIIGGILNISSWNRNSSSLFSKGTIILSGGVINASGSILFSSTQITGTMNGPFILNVGNDFYIASTYWSTVTNGTINLLGTGTVQNYFFVSPNSTTSAIAYNLNINAPGKTYIICRSDGNTNLFINNNFTIVAGAVQAFNGSYNLSTFDINGNLTIENGATLDCNGTYDPNVNIAGNWINNGGSFVPGSNTVILDGTNQTISGANTFNNLTKNGTTAAQLTFKTGTTNKTTVTNSLTLHGSTGQLLSLRSFTNGTQWEIDPQGTRDLSYLDVKDSKNTNALNIQACNLVNSGNNTKWDFLAAAAAGTITGTPTVSQGQTGVSYSVPAIANASGYLWSLPTGATITDGFNTRNITVSFSPTAESGDITVQGTSSCGNGAVSPAYHVTVTPLVGIPESNSVDYIILYPDPVTHILTIESSSEIKSIGISGITGNVIMKRTNLNLKMFQIDMNAYVSGVYILNIILRDNPKVPVIRKIIKN